MITPRPYFLPELTDHHVNDDIGEFYNGPIDIWKKILGPKMHYHFGLFKGRGSVTMEDCEFAFDNAVQSLYPFLPYQGLVYDIGCGWGGPLVMLAEDLNARVVGITSSFIQYQYVSSLGFDTQFGDIEKSFPPCCFHCGLMLESFCHVINKERLLDVLKIFTPRLVMRVHCQDQSAAGTVFGDSMHLISSGELKHLFMKTGWKIKHWENVRARTLPSVSYWNHTLQSVPITSDKHIETLRSWTSYVLIDPAAWGANNPLIEVMVER